MRFSLTRAIRISIVIRFTFIAYSSWNIFFAWTLAIYRITNVRGWSFTSTATWLALVLIFEKSCWTLITPWAFKAIFASTLTSFYVTKACSWTFWITIFTFWKNLIFLIVNSDNLFLHCLYSHPSVNAVFYSADSY